MASSPSTSHRSSWKPDVFLSFRGADTRNTFTGHLYQALNAKGVDTFIDDKLERGNEISPALLQAIEDSRISIVVFSENYASSPYCLDELVQIPKVKRSKRQIVLPIFYNVDPSDVEEQSGNFARQFHTLLSTSLGYIYKEENWRMAMAEAANLSGWHLDNGHEAKIEKVLTILNRTFLHVADYPIGLDFHLQEMNSMLDVTSDDVRVVGICGFGGVGKTTIAKAIYNRIAHQFEGSCFLANVREMSKQYTVAQLQETLLFEILGDKRVLMGNFHLGINMVRVRLSRKKVLLVIDDVDTVDQLKKLAGDLDWFGRGSRIIVTTRDEHLLAVHGVERVHKVQTLCPDDALQLFCWNAFKKSQPMEGYVEHSRSIVQYAKGLPLALVVLGSFLYGRDMCEWGSQLSRLKRIPNKEVYEVLKISYDGLEDNEKAIFLDIACFFRGVDKDYAIKVLDACDLDPIIGLKILTEKSLISIENNRLQLHDLLQSMGRQVVHSESPTMPSRRSRLWFHEDVLSIIAENMGTDSIEGIMLDLSKPVEIHLTAETFMKMKRLRILIVLNALPTVGPINLPNQLRCLEWPGCTLTLFPSTFHARKLVVLDMHSSSIKHFEGFKVVYSFSRYYGTDSIEGIMLDLSKPVEIHLTAETFMKMKRLRILIVLNALPTVGPINLPNQLRCLEWPGCTLTLFPSTFHARKLVVLDMHSSSIKHFEGFKNYNFLKIMDLRYCELLTKTPDFSTIPHLERLNLEGCTNLVEVHQSVGWLDRLQFFSLDFCSNLRSLPDFLKLKSLDTLLLTGCEKLEAFPDIGENMTRLEKLSISRSAIEVLPLSMVNIVRLHVLHLINCKNLSILPRSLYKLKYLQRLVVEGCSELGKYHVFSWSESGLILSVDELCSSLQRCSGFTMLKCLHLRSCKLSELNFLKAPYCFTMLEELDLSGNSFVILPDIKRLLNLRRLTLSDCKELKEIGKSPPRLKRIEAQNCKSLESVGRLKWSNIHDIDFSNCHKLVESQHIFLDDDALRLSEKSRNRRVEMLFPGNGFPKWSSYSSEKDSSSLWSQIMRGSVAFHIGIIMRGSVLGAPTRSSPKKCGVSLICKKGAIVDGSSASQSISHMSKSSSLDLMRSYWNNGLEFRFDVNMKRGRTAEHQHNPQLPVSFNLNDIGEREILAEHQSEPSVFHLLQRNKMKDQDPLLLSLSLKPTNQYDIGEREILAEHQSEPSFFHLLQRNKMKLVPENRTSHLQTFLNEPLRQDVVSDSSEDEITPQQEQDPPLLSLSLKPTNQYERGDLVAIATLLPVEHHPWNHDLSLSLPPRNWISKKRKYLDLNEPARAARSSFSYSEVELNPNETQLWLPGRSSK